MLQRIYRFNKRRTSFPTESRILSEPNTRIFIPGMQCGRVTTDSLTFAIRGIILGNTQSMKRLDLPLASQAVVLSEVEL